MSYAHPIDNSRLLCKLIQTKPELYNPKHPDYCNRPLHSKTWKDLAGKMGVTVSEFRAKWISLRNSYARCLKAKQLYPNRRRSKWYLEDNMNFLERHILQRRKRKNFLEDFEPDNENSSLDIMDKDSSKNADDQSIADHDSQNDKDEELRSTTYDESKTKIQNHNPKRRNPCLDELDDIFWNKDEHDQNNSIENKKLKNISSQELAIPPQIDSLVNTVTTFFETQTAQLKQNPDDLFFQSIEKDYQTLTDKKKRKFKLTVLNTLNDLLDEVEQ